MMIGGHVIACRSYLPFMGIKDSSILKSISESVVSSDQPVPFLPHESALIDCQAGQAFIVESYSKVLVVKLYIYMCVCVFYVYIYIYKYTNCFSSNHPRVFTNMDVENPWFPWENDLILCWVASTSMLVYPRVISKLIVDFWIFHIHVNLLPGSRPPVPAQRKHPPSISLMSLLPNVTQVNRDV